MTMGRRLRTSAGKSFRAGQGCAAGFAGIAAMFGTCAYAGGGWHIIQGAALTVVVIVAVVIWGFQRLIRDAELAYRPPVRAAVAGPPSARARPVTAVAAPRLTAGAGHRTVRAQPVDPTRTKVHATQRKER